MTKLRRDLFMSFAALCAVSVLFSTIGVGQASNAADSITAEKVKAHIVTLADDKLEGRETWRQDQSLIVAMNHDDGAHEAGREAPRRGPAMLQHATLVEITDVESLCKVLAEVVRRAGLQGFTVSHHGFD